MSSDYQLHSWFTYSMLLLFLSTAGFWVMFITQLSFVLHGLANVAGFNFEYSHFHHLFADD